jgi:hypothetical protein
MDKLPLEIVKHIISYDKRFIIRNGKIIQINQIDKNDKRYNLLESIKLKYYDIYHNSSSVYITIDSHKDFCIKYNDYKLEIVTLWCDEKGDMEIVEIE